MRYVITGGAGYIGSRLVAALIEREDTETVVICDVKPPQGFRPKTRYEQFDVRDGERFREILEREEPDVLVHLAFILNPIKDEDTMYDIDVNGTQKVLDAASKAGVGHVLVTSSATAYGAFPDNPVPMEEDWPVRGVSGFSYARDKTEADRLCQLWALEHPDRTMTIVRPCIVMGPNVDNYLVRLWSDQPFQVDFGNMDGLIQFVHEDDVVSGIVGLLHGKHAGAYNFAGEGFMTYRECAQLIDSKVRRIPLAVAKRMQAAMWKLGQAESPPGSIAFALHPWVVSNEKLKATIGWEPKSSREAFLEGMQGQGKLPAVGVPEPAPAAA
ncbi:MAG: NAD-dependent epimerase/dehydratase family protein [Thermoleophilaceae bacterium]|nr:NAD-dependent epimerase/dehydratase family protein [Thermoleophilaceae bacterium]